MNRPSPITALLGSLHGETVIVRGDGPSAFEVERAGAIEIAVNRAALTRPCDFAMVPDWNFYHEHAASFRVRRGLVSQLNVLRGATAYGIRSPDFWFAPMHDPMPGDERAYLLSDGGSVLFAVHLAVRLGAREIIVSGFDCGPVEGRWYHGEHDTPADHERRASLYAEYSRAASIAFGAWRRALGVEINRETRCLVETR